MTHHDSSSSMNRHSRPTNRERLHALLDVLSYLYIIHGKPGRARDYLTLLVKLRPSESRLLRSLARSELESGNAVRAKEILEESLELEMTPKERAVTFLMLSRVLWRLQRLEDSGVAAYRFLEEKHHLNYQNNFLNEPLVTGNE